jgi:hypothetical protein
MNNFITPEDINKLKAKIIKEKKDLARPIGFNQLIKDGILSKKGVWYEVKDWKRLPKYARLQIRGVVGGVNTKTLVKF